MADHLHIFFGMRPTQSLSGLNEYLEFLEKFEVPYDEQYLFKPVEYNTHKEGLFRMLIFSPRSLGIFMCFLGQLKASYNEYPGSRFIHLYEWK